MDDEQIDRVIDMSAARSLRVATWQARVQRNKDGDAFPTVANGLILFANDPVLTAMLAFNSFTSQHLLTRPPPVPEDGAFEAAGPYPRPWDASDVALMQSYFQRVWSPRFARATVEDAMLAASHQHRFHPVCDWIESLKWDGIKRLDNWLINAFDCHNTEYHRAIGAKFLIGAVRRVRHPGSKFDYMMVLEGSQGIGKSRSVAKLFNGDWFSDAIPADLNSRDAAMALLGIWCLEFAEIEHLIRSEVETIKAFLSRSVDRYRPPYGKAYVDRPRQCVLVGTTNSDDYLRDSTGNRRIWPVHCRSVSVDWIEINRDQLWAEAAIREASGEAIWLNDELIAKQASDAQADRLAEDMWEADVDRFLLGRDEIRLHQILTDGLAIPKERMTRSHELRVAAILRKKGWRRVQRKVSGNVFKVWISVSHLLPDQPLDDEGYLQ